MAKVIDALAPSEDAVLLRLFDVDYPLAEAKRGRLKKVDAMRKKLAKMQDAGDDDLNADDQVAMIAQMLGCMLENGDAAAAALVKAWKSDDISMQQITRMMDAVTTAMNESAADPEA